MNEHTPVIRQFPEHVTILTPMYTPLLRGVLAHGPNALGVMGCNMRVRISRRDHNRIVAVCNILNMRPAAFCRWTAAHAANALIPYVPDFDPTQRQRIRESWE